MAIMGVNAVVFHPPFETAFIPEPEQPVSEAALESQLLEVAESVEVVLKAPTPDPESDTSKGDGESKVEAPVEVAKPKASTPEQGDNTIGRRIHLGDSRAWHDTNDAISEKEMRDAEDELAAKAANKASTLEQGGVEAVAATQKAKAGGGGF